VGVAVWAGNGQPFNKVAGLGFDLLYGRAVLVRNP
jgi:hypothetical protein